MSFITPGITKVRILTSLAKVFLKQSKVPLYRRVSPGFGLGWVCNRTWGKYAGLTNVTCDQWLQYVTLEILLFKVWCWKNVTWPLSDIQKLHSVNFCMQILIYRKLIFKNLPLRLSAILCFSWHEGRRPSWSQVIVVFAYMIMKPEQPTATLQYGSKGSTLSWHVWAAKRLFLHLNGRYVPK